jgi:hypothetical protein
MFVGRRTSGSALLCFATRRSRPAPQPLSNPSYASPLHVYSRRRSASRPRRRAAHAADHPPLAPPPPRRVWATAIAAPPRATLALTPLSIDVALNKYPRPVQYEV